MVWDWGIGLRTEELGVQRFRSGLCLFIGFSSAFAREGGLQSEPVQACTVSAG